MFDLIIFSPGLSPGYWKSRYSLAVNIIDNYYVATKRRAPMCRAISAYLMHALAAYWIIILYKSLVYISNVNIRSFYLLWYSDALKRAPPPKCISYSTYAVSYFKNKIIVVTTMNVVKSGSYFWIDKKLIESVSGFLLTQNVTGIDCVRAVMSIKCVTLIVSIGS